MIKEKCNHKWRHFKNAESTIPAKYECENCKIWLSASDVYQLETLNYLRGFQKFLSTIAIIISIIALFISLQN